MLDWIRTHYFCLLICNNCLYGKQLISWFCASFFSLNDILMSINICIIYVHVCNVHRNCINICVCFFYLYMYYCMIFYFLKYQLRLSWAFTPPPESSFVHIAINKCTYLWFSLNYMNMHLCTSKFSTWILQLYNSEFTI